MISLSRHLEPTDLLALIINTQCICFLFPASRCRERERDVWMEYDECVEAQVVYPAGSTINTVRASNGCRCSHFTRGKFNIQARRTHECRMNSPTVSPLRLSVLNSSLQVCRDGFENKWCLRQWYVVLENTVER